jgi:ATP/maltotriose-dependent transcriptional regulator MalT
MTPDETAAVMRLRTGKTQSKDAARLLHEKTQGWAAGVVLMEALQSRGGGRSGPEKMEPGRISDYFAGEIFGKLSEDTRDFLLKTSYFHRFTPAMAEAITGNKQAAQILAEFNHRNYFIERRNGPDLTYQYHAMFREFLKSLADCRYSAAERFRLMQSAAKLLEEAGQVEDAVELFIEARDWPGLTHLLLNHAPFLAAQGRDRTLESWINCIPREVIEINPWLLYWMAVSMVHYRPNDSTPLFERAYDLFNQAEDASGVLLSWSGAVDSILFQFDRFSRFDHWVDKLGRALKKYKGFPSPEIETRVTLSMFSALDLRKPQHPHAVRWRERMVALAKRNGDVNLEAIAAFHAAWHELYIGHPKKSALFLQAVEK